jgi:hypothetical protein
MTGRGEGKGRGLNVVVWFDSGRQCVEGEIPFGFAQGILSSRWRKRGTSG